MITWQIWMHKQTNRRRKHEAILGPAGYALCTRPVFKNVRLSKMTHMAWAWGTVTVAPFLGHLPSTVYSERKGRGDLVMCRYTDSRNTESSAPKKYLKALSSNVHPRAGSQSVRKAATIQFIVQYAKGGLTELLLSPVCLQSVYLMSPHMTRSCRPSPYPFADCKQSRLEMGMAWERC